MATNGGTLHGNPHQQQRGQYNCSQCGLTFDSAESLQVHMHYHPESMTRWGAPPTSNGPPTTGSSTASNSPTDSENNNHPKRHHSSVTSKSASPMHNTISAAADSSDNQPPTPQPTSVSSGGGTGVSSESRSIAGHAYGGPGTGGSSYQHQTEMHYPAYMHSYEQYYHHHNMEYGIPPPHFLNNQSAAAQQEYKAVPSPRYHPYISHSMNQSHPTGQSALSPRIVSSSSPTQNNLMHSTTTAPSNPQGPPPGQPTPSPSPKQCDKCGLVCETACQLNDHYATAHGTAQSESTGSLNRSGSNEETEMPNFTYSNTVYIKEEPPCDILDLDSQKMVYPPHDENNQGPLPPMHSLHPMQRPPMMWSHDHHAFIPPHHPQDMKPSLFQSIKQEYTHTPAPSIKSEFSPPSLIKSEYGQQTQITSHPNQPDVKPFNNEVSSNQVASSPSDFPTTTTPQENGVQFRTFEAATSSLPANSSNAKSSSWKSNEARRPKTYNCTACNKWFTSSGHLKRHYNTTLHKNAVKSSGQPDPATMPISIHHHPARDQNQKHHHRGSPAQAPPPVPPEPPRSPDYMSQYTPPLGFQQAAPGFQQYGANIHSNAGGPPNGQAGLSVRASQPRGLLIYLTNTGTQHTLPAQEQQTFMQPIQLQQLPQYNTTTTTTNSMEQQYNITSPITINTNTQLYQATPHQEALQPNYHIITGNPMDVCEGSTDSSLIYDQVMESENDDDRLQHVNHHHQQQQQQQQQQQPHHQSNNDNTYAATTIPCISALRRLTGGAAAYQGDTAPPFSPDIPETFQMTNNQTHQSSRSQTPHVGATAPESPSPCSPSITSTGTPTPSEQTELRCIQCDKVFNKACYLTQHNKTFHSGEKPYKCQRCGKRFPCGQSHEEHFAKHGNNKPFKCEQCPKQFNHKTDLRRHMCLHSGTKPYACDSCGKGFIRKDHMVKHCETHRRKSALMAKKLEHISFSNSTVTTTTTRSSNSFTSAIGDTSKVGSTTNTIIAPASVLVT